MALSHSVVPEPKETDDGNESDKKSRISSGSAKKSKLKRTREKMKSNAQKPGPVGEQAGNDGGVTIEVRHEGALSVPDEDDDATEADESAIIDEYPEYQGQSPDEVALVKSAREYSTSLLGRTLETMVINHFGAKEKYTTLAELEFNSDCKRMSMILRKPEGKLTMYTKGVDNNHGEVAPQRDEPQRNTRANRRVREGRAAYSWVREERVRR